MMKMDVMLDLILAPCCNEKPCGEDLSFSPEFDRIQEARREDDPTVDYGEWQTALKQADWPLVVETCTELLIKRSKDLRLSAWLTEGAVKTEGFAGLARGVEIVAHLLQRFGADIHPQAEAGDQEQRIGSLSWLVMRMSVLVRQVPLTASVIGSYSLNDYDSARQLQAQLQRDPDSVADIEGKVTLEKFSNAARKTDKERYVQWGRDLEHCFSALDQLVLASDSLFGTDGPSLSQLHALLDAVHSQLQVISSEVGIAAATATKNSTLATETHADVNGHRTVESPRQRIRNRDDALEILREVATFFRQTEPHSPVAYLADKAAQWGAMPLHAWLRSVVKDRGTLSNIEELLGLDLEAASAKD